MIPNSDPDDPVNWPGGTLIGIALIILLPQLIFLIIGWNIIVPIWATAGIALWIVISTKSSYEGFPFSFDFVAMQIFLGSVSLTILAVFKMIQRE